MTVKVAINGFGRIGRLVLRSIVESGRSDVQVVGINDLGDADMNAYLLRRDSVHGPFPGTVATEGSDLVVNGRTIRTTAEKDPSKLPWGELGVDVAMECTGLFTDHDKAAAHLDAGARKVLISAPGKNVPLTVVYGVNHADIKPDHTIISNASCTTNCLAPVAFVLHRGFGIERGYMTTIHAYTGDQRLHDSLHKDKRRARAAGLSMIPTSTGAAKAVGLVLPELAGKLDGTAIRVPTPNVSLVDLKINTPRDVTRDEVNDALVQAASDGPLKGILKIEDQPNVSVDFNHDPASSTVDITQTQVIDGRLVRVMSWYDNEWGFSNRMADTAVALAQAG